MLERKQGGAQEKQESLARLEEETKRRLQRLKEEKADSKPTAPRTNELATHELSQSSQAAIARQSELKDAIAKRKRAREMAVPTNDNAVKLKLRDYAEPVCLFAEAAPERRERLRDVMTANLDQCAQ